MSIFIFCVEDNHHEIFCHFYSAGFSVYKSMYKFVLKCISVEFIYARIQLFTLTLCIIFTA